jgi:hypothetical protein
MNNTKWSELVKELASMGENEPLVNIKLIFDEGNNDSFSLVWWDEVEREGFELIEWIKIKPFKTDKIDFTEQIRSRLKIHNIHYNYESGMFVIYGYKRPN